VYEKPIKMAYVIPTKIQKLLWTIAFNFPDFSEPKPISRTLFSSLPCGAGSN